MNEGFPPKALAGIFFDLDGVLVDSENLHARTKKETLHHFGVEVGMEVCLQFCGRTDEDFFATMQASYPQLKTDIDTLIQYKTAAYIRLYPELQPIPGALQFINQAYALGLKLAVVTSATPLSQEVAFQLLGISKMISVVVNADHVQHHKPHPEPYLIAAEQLGEAAKSSFVIEDSTSGIRSAKAAGLLVMGLGTTLPTAELLAAGANWAVDSYDALVYKLAKIFPEGARPDIGVVGRDSNLI